MAISKLWAGVASLMLACLFFSAGAQAQSRDLGAEALILDDGAGHRLRISVPTTGWPGLGTFEWVLPLPPTGVTAGFVESGTAALTSLEWDDAGKYWKAVAESTGGTVNADILALPTTTPTAGQVTVNAIPFMHSYGVENTFLGQGAGNFTMTGEANTGVGFYALSANQTGDVNTAVGRSALSSNTTGGTNSAVGYAALTSNTTGGLNTAVGSHSLVSSTTAYSNTAVGTNTLLSNSTGSSNTAIGTQALQSNTTANNNSALGNLALYGNTTGTENTAVGANALQDVTTGSNNTALGSQTDVSSGALTNTTALGYQAIATADNQIMLGNSNVTLIQSTGGLLLNGTTGTTPASGFGKRMMWIPAKAAFRAGEVWANQWDDANIGQASTAVGFITTASGGYSFAGGWGSTASGASSFAYGTSVASDQHAVAMGNGNTASGAYSVALGQSSTASGPASTSIGQITTASGWWSTAMGNTASTNGMEGSFIYGDHSTNSVVTNTVANQFMVRAAGGTIFYSSSDLSTGVTLAAGGGAWASVSDSNRKANRLNIDGEDVLNKLSNIWMGSWNYKSQDKTMRHYGPMAQEFFAAFGKDGMGVIGNDTTLATADVDGVTLIAVKALIDRNDALESRVEALEAVIRQLAIERETTIHRTMMK